MGTDAALQGLAERIDGVVAEGRLVGAACCVIRDGRLWEHCAGWADAEARVPVTSRTLFRLSSVTKLYTATAVVLRAGHLLDTPLVDLLNELELEGGARAMTLRHVLSHSSGLEDLVDDVGGEEDAVERYVRVVPSLGQLHPPGRRFSYCNAGFVLAGRVLETLVGTSWEPAITASLLAPWDLRDTDPRPGEGAELATGYARMPSGQQVAVPRWSSPRCMGPSSGLWASAPAVAAFVLRHLEARGAGDPDTAALLTMRRPQLPVRDYLAEHVGLGWLVTSRDPRPRMISGAGYSFGHTAVVHAVPAAGVAVVLLSSGGAPPPLNRMLLNPFLSAVAGTELPDLPRRPDVSPHVELDRYVGRYERRELRVTIERAGGALVMTTRALVPGDDPGISGAVLEAIDERTFLLDHPGRVSGTVHFDAFDERGRPTFIHFWLRDARRRE
jgi:CubicO group peptidase (beta-lactamase class C family)